MTVEEAIEEFLIQILDQLKIANQLKALELRTQGLAVLTLTPALQDSIDRVMEGRP